VHSSCFWAPKNGGRRTAADTRATCGQFSVRDAGHSVVFVVAIIIVIVVVVVVVVVVLVLIHRNLFMLSGMLGGRE
jgi:hypothetical protein